MTMGGQNVGPMAKPVIYAVYITMVQSQYFLSLESASVTSFPYRFHWLFSAGILNIIFPNFLPCMWLNCPSTHSSAIRAPLFCLVFLNRQCFSLSILFFQIFLLIFPFGALHLPISVFLSLLFCSLVAQRGKYTALSFILCLCPRAFPHLMRHLFQPIWPCFSFYFSPLFLFFLSLFSLITDRSSSFPQGLFLTPVLSSQP